MNKKWRPANGTEGMDFTEKYCDRCVHENDCEILERSMGLKIIRLISPLTVSIHPAMIKYC